MTDIRKCKYYYQNKPVIELLGRGRDYIYFGYLIRALSYSVAEAYEKTLAKRAQKHRSGKYFYRGESVSRYFCGERRDICNFYYFVRRGFSITEAVKKADSIRIRRAGRKVRRGAFKRTFV